MSVTAVVAAFQSNAWVQAIKIVQEQSDLDSLYLLNSPWEFTRPPHSSLLGQTWLPLFASKITDTIALLSCVNSPGLLRRFRGFRSCFTHKLAHLTLTFMIISLLQWVTYVFFRLDLKMLSLERVEIIQRIIPNDKEVSFFDKKKFPKLCYDLPDM